MTFKNIESTAIDLMSWNALNVAHYVGEGTMQIHQDNGLAVNGLTWCLTQHKCLGHSLMDCSHLSPWCDTPQAKGYIQVTTKCGFLYCGRPWYSTCEVSFMGSAITN